MEDKDWWSESKDVEASLMETAKIDGFENLMQQIIEKFIESKMLSSSSGDLDLERQMARLMQDCYDIPEDEDTKPCYLFKGSFRDVLILILLCNTKEEIQNLLNRLSRYCYHDDEE